MELKYSRKSGYYLVGDEAILRALAYQFIDELLIEEHGEIVLYRILWEVDINWYALLKNQLLQLRKENDLAFIPSKTEFLIYFLGFVFLRSSNKKIDISAIGSKYGEDIRLFKTVVSFMENCRSFCSFKDITNESYYVLLVFLTILQGNHKEPDFNFLMDCAREMIAATEKITAISFSDYNSLLENVYTHLVPAYFRIQYGFPLNNVLIGDIKKQYGEVYTLVEQAMLPLRKLLRKPINEAEIGYFTILFGGAILNQQEKERGQHYQALIICPSGVSSSLIMKSELEKMFPLIDFSSTSEVNRMDDLDLNSYDIIFSNVPLSIKQKVYHIKPVMSQLEKARLLQTVQNELIMPGVIYPTADEILQMILPYITINSGHSVHDLREIISKKIDRKINYRNDVKPLLSELLTADKITLSEDVFTWEEAIQLAAKPLVTANQIEPRYIEAMINKVYEFGPFINIGEYIALPHARPEDGVNQLGMSLLKVQQPVNLLDDEKHPIKIFICIAAIDNETHLKALATLTKILSNKESLNQLLNAQSKTDILTLIHKDEEEL